MCLRALVLSLFCLVARWSLAQSVYTERPDDSHAVYLQPGSFGAHGDGIADDTDALQTAINRVQETTGQGVLFLADARYRITHTIYLWQGIRIVGYGAHRPVLVLSEDTPGYQEGHGFPGTGRYMLQFAERRPGPGQPVVDANEFTFYSALSNLDFEIGPGNPAAIAVRFHVAQHSFLSHIHINVGEGRAALEDVGNQASDLVIEGGAYGIITQRTAPAWQFLLMDSRISGQRLAAIHTEEAGMTLIRDEIAHVPVAVEISHGMPEQLYGRDLLLRDIAQVAFVLGDVSSQHHQVTLEHVACIDVTKMLQTDQYVAAWNPIASPGHFFVEDKLTLGQEIDSHGREGEIALRHHERILPSEPKLTASDIPALPPMPEWQNVRSLGATGDGGADDLPALQHAVATHRVLYFPEGVYRLRGTLHLRRNTVLIGFSPVATQLTLWDEDPVFMGAGAPVPLLSTPPGGTNIVAGIGVSAGDVAPRAAGVEWQSGPRSFMDDVNFPRGRGHLAQALAPGMQQPVSSVRGQDHRGTQFPSLWIHEGGGIFRNIWTADTIARAGVLIENAQTPGTFYQISCEHHLHNEVQVTNASHWAFYALQTEEEKPDGADAVAVELNHAQDILFANQFEYRVSRNVLPKLAGSVVRDSANVQWHNMHDFSMTRLAFDDSVLDESAHVAVRTHDFTTFTVNANTMPGPPLPLPEGFAPGAKLQKLADGFSNASGLTVDDAGVLYFTDSAEHRVYRWNAASKRAEIVTDKIDAPQSAVFVTPSTLMVIDNSKAVYAVALDGSGSVHRLAGESIARPGSRLLLPVGLHEDIASLTRLVDHRGFLYAPRSNMAITAEVGNEPRSYFYAPGSNTAIMAGGTWKPLLQSSQESAFFVGENHLAVSESDDKVYGVTLNELDSLSAFPVLPRGGTSVVEDARTSLNTTFLAGAQLFVYGPQLAHSRAEGVVEIPERPSSLAIGGPEHRTLFIGARSALYSIQLPLR